MLHFRVLQVGQILHCTRSCQRTKLLLLNLLYMSHSAVSTQCKEITNCVKLSAVFIVPVSGSVL
jgi:hypothetical protein